MALTLLFTPPLAAQSCPSSESLRGAIADAESAYIQRSYEELIQGIDPLVNPMNCFETEETQIEAHLLLGIAQFQLGELAIAELEFLAMLRIDPDYRIENLLQVPKSIAAYVEQVRELNSDELDEIRAMRGGGEGVIVETLYVQVEDERHQLWIAFLPFGAGQFQNEDWALGWTLAGLQVTAVAVGFVGAFSVEALRGSTGRFTSENAEAARQWQIVQIAGIAAFGALYLGGVAHGWANFQEVSRTVLPPTKEAPQSNEPAAWFIAPWLSPESAGAGVGIIW